MRSSLLLIILSLCISMIGCTSNGGGESSNEDSEPSVERTIRVTFRGIRNTKGLLHCGLFASPEGFPDQTRQACRTATIPASSEEAVFIFEDLSSGEYAVAALHDENGNGKLDTNFLGIPIEGGGASNNPEPRMGPPLYENARFLLKDEPLELEVQLRYF